MDNLFCTDGYMDIALIRVGRYAYLTAKNNDERMYVFVMSW
jgi:hypothetical protein